VKTCSSGELELIQKILPRMHKHLKTNPFSLLSRIYGVYTVEMQDYQKVHLILMGNTLRFDNKNDVNRIYDLKGSTYSREVKGRVSSSSTLKDQNFVKNQHHVQEINLVGRDCELINTAIRKDSNFLASVNIMDYSLLLGIEAKVHVNTGAIERSASIVNRDRNNLSTTAELTRFKRHRFQSLDGL